MRHVTGTEPALLLHAERPAEELEWLALRLRAELDEGARFDAGEGYLLGTVLCRWDARGEALALQAPSFDGDEDPDRPDHYDDDLSFVLRLAREQQRVAESYDVEALLTRDLFHGMRAQVQPGWEGPASFIANREPAFGSDSGWQVQRSGRQELPWREVSIRELLTGNPMLARFIRWPAGTLLDYDFGDLSVYLGEDRLPPREQSWVALQLAQQDMPFDAERDGELVQWLRERPHDGMLLSALVGQRRFLSRRAADSLVRQIELRLKRDRAYDLDLVRKLRSILRRGLEDGAVRILAQETMTDEVRARAFIERHREAITAGEIPPRLDDDL